MVTRVECGDTLRPSRHFARWQRKAGDDPSEIGLDSFRIGAATTLATGEEVSQRVIQREGRWKSSESSNIYTRNNLEDTGIAQAHERSA